MGDYLFRCSASMASTGTNKKTKIVFYAQKLETKKTETGYEIPQLSPKAIPLLVLNGCSTDFSTMETNRADALGAIEFFSKFKFLPSFDVNIFRKWNSVLDNSSLIEYHKESIKEHDNYKEQLDFNERNFDIRSFRTPQILNAFQEYVQDKPLDLVTDETIHTALWGIMHDCAENSAYVLIDGQVFKIQASVYLNSAFTKLCKIPLLKNDIEYNNQQDYSNALWKEILTIYQEGNTTLNDSIIKVWGINAPVLHKGKIYESIVQMLKSHIQSDTNMNAIEKIIKNKMASLIQMKYLYDLGIPIYRITAAGQDYDNLEQKEMLNTVAFMNN